MHIISLSILFLSLFSSALSQASPQCTTDACCETLQGPNPNRSGYLQFSTVCFRTPELDDNCLGITGCQRCHDPLAVPPPGAEFLTPPCSRTISTTTSSTSSTSTTSTTGTPPTTGTTGSRTTGTPGGCTTQACCDRVTTPSFGTHFSQPNPICVAGDPLCVGTTGCRYCYNPQSNDTITIGLDICQRFLPCPNDECCINIQNPNTETGEGYYQFNSRCLSGGALHCVQITGCEICFNYRGTGPNHGNRPPCTRYLPCNSDDCCSFFQTDDDPLEFSLSCLGSDISSSNCVGNTGCRHCYNPNADLPNPLNHPVCNRLRVPRFM